MGKRIARGKNQILLGLLPGKTMDAKPAIVRIDRVSGVTRPDLSMTAILTRVSDETRAWLPENRPGFPDDLVGHGDFILVDPKHADASLFPKVFWCQNRSCGAVFDFSNRDELPPPRCTECAGTGVLRQLRWVQFHRCGDIRPLKPPFNCGTCGASRWRFDLRASERLGGFRWLCGRCRRPSSVYAGPCRACTQRNPEEQRASVDVHRSGKVYYAHTTTLLNVPNRAYEALLARDGSGVLVAPKYLNLPEAQGIRLSDMASQTADTVRSAPAITSSDLDALLAGGPDLSIEELKRRIQDRLAPVDEPPERTGSWTEVVEARTGVPSATWDMASAALLDALLPRELGLHQDILPADSAADSREQAVANLGLERLTLLPDFPVLTAAYGYSREDYQPDAARLNPFPPDRDLGGKKPIFVDVVGADAVVLTLNKERIRIWLEQNGVSVTLPPGDSAGGALSGYFVTQMTNRNLRETIPSADAATRMTFGLLHTLGHLAVRQASVLSGLDRTSISEYLIPQALSVTLFCSHRGGATIGALTSLFEETASQWLGLVRDASRCVYDPVCRETSGSCHACTHLAETSCRYFNLNLNRAFLFGGPDAALETIRVGYLDASPSI